MDKSNYFSDAVKCEWIKPVKYQRFFRLEEKQHLRICCSQEIHFRNERYKYVKSKRISCKQATIRRKLEWLY